MNQNVGASFSLSVLTVVFFAVILYHPEPPPPAATSGVTPAGEVRSDGRGLSDGGARTPLTPIPTEALVDRLARPLTPARGDGLASSPFPPVAMNGAREGEAAHVAVARPVSRRAPGPVAVDEDDEPRGAFTRVRAGERLADVARRVYGSADAVDTLWLANRDILDRSDEPLAVGSLLRTPEGGARAESREPRTEGRGPRTEGRRVKGRSGST